MLVLLFAHIFIGFLRFIGRLCIKNAAKLLFFFEICKIFSNFAPDLMILCILICIL